MKKFIETNLPETMLYLTLIIAFCGLICTGGCQAMSDTAQKVSDDLGNNAINASALIDIWKITPSDPVTNGAPSGKKVTVIGNISSVPVVQGENETLKDYAEYEKTKTPAWYNKDNVTTVERLRWTSSNSIELQKAFLKKFEVEN